MINRAASSGVKQRAATVSVLSNSALTLFKVLTGLITGSVSVLSEALHSGLDLLAAFMALLAVRKSRQPADADHQFGHGKFESLSGLIEAALILVAVALIVWNALDRLLFKHPEIRQIHVGIAVMAVSAILNVFVSRMLFRVARNTDSVALAADAWHLRTDVWTSVGVLGGLAVISIAKFAGLRGSEVIDSIAALIVAAVIVWAALGIMRQSWDHLVDRSLPVDETEIIASLLRDHYPEFSGYHQLRTRKAGSQRYIDLHLEVLGEVPVAKAHELCDHLENDLHGLFPEAEVLIHVEPKSNE